VEGGKCTGTTNAVEGGKCAGTTNALVKTVRYPQGLM
jgi:hypothetical protein